MDEDMLSSGTYRFVVPNRHLKALHYLRKKKYGGFALARDFQAWIQTPAALAIARTLLHSLWQDLVAAVVLAACLRFIKTSRIRCGAAGFALIVIVVISIGTFLLVMPASAGRAQFQRSVFPAVTVSNPDHANGGDDPSLSMFQRLLPWITPV